MLEDLRKSIDLLDEALLSILAERIRIVEKVGKFKKESNLPALDQERWNTVLENIAAQGEDKGLDQELVIELWGCIHKHALKIEDRAKGI